MKKVKKVKKKIVIKNFLMSLYDDGEYDFMALELTGDEYLSIEKVIGLKGTLTFEYEESK